MAGNAAPFLLQVVPQGCRSPEDAPQALVSASKVVEERRLVVSLADLADDGAGLEDWIDLLIDLNNIIVFLEGGNEGAEIHMREVLVRVRDMVALS